MTENDGGKTGGVLVQHMFFIGLFHQAVFVSIESLAIYSHFKAMITDPGAVSPDAKPMPWPEEEEELALQGPELNVTNSTGAIVRKAFFHFNMIFMLFMFFMFFIL
ncbi:hypothetical protein ACA910_014656 [Epithemia clementina (nom. ined.)]